VRATRTGLGEGTTARRCCIGDGAVTWISGNAVAPDAPWDHAGPPDAHSSKDAELERSNDRFMEDDIVPILKTISDCPERIGHI
jgi:hypothetical protein